VVHIGLQWGFILKFTAFVPLFYPPNTAKKRKERGGNTGKNEGERNYVVSNETCN